MAFWKLRKHMAAVFFLGVALSVSTLCGNPVVTAAEETSESQSLTMNWPDLQQISSELSGDDLSGDLFGDTADSEENHSDDAFVALFGAVTPYDGPYSNEALDAFRDGFSLQTVPYDLSFSEFEKLPLFYTNKNLIERGGVKYLRGSWTALENELTEMIESYAGDWSLYVKDLVSDETISINNHSMQSASLIKLFIAGATYEQIENETMTETDTITNALSQMIIVSDNESANVLVRAMCDDSGEFSTGLAKVNDFIARYGFTDTEQVNGISDPTLWVSDGRVNMTSTADCGRMMELIYDGTLISHFSSFRFEVLLNKQEVNYKIPAGLPDGVHISHKTGEETNTENDAAIIYTPYGDYIFCVMSTDLSDTGTAVDHIHEMTRLVYDYFVTDLIKVEGEN